MLFTNKKVLDTCRRNLKVPRLNEVVVGGKKFYFPLTIPPGRIGVHNAQKPRHND